MDIRPVGMLYRRAETLLSPPGRGTGGASPIVAWGDAGAIQARVAEHRKRGADHVCLQVLRTDLAAPPTRELEAIAKVVL